MARCKVVPDHQSQTRETQPQNIQPQLHMPSVQRAASSLVVLLGKREVWRERTLFIEKKGSLSPQSLPAFQS